MSDAGDDIPIEASAAVEVAAEAPKGKLSVEDALQVGFFFFLLFWFQKTQIIFIADLYVFNL